MASITNILKYIYRKPQHWIIRLFSFLFSQRLNTDILDNVLIISPHPDDEVFGCGGLIAELCKKNAECKIIFLSKGEGTADKRHPELEIIEKRRELTSSALEKLGVSQDSIFYLSFIDGHFANTDENETARLSALIDRINPSFVFYPHPNDGSPDHEHASKIIESIISNKSFEKYQYCVWIWHHTRLWKTLFLKYRSSFLLPINKSEKNEVAKIYYNAKDKSGFYYSGRLPELFLQATIWNNELYFRKK